MNIAYINHTSEIGGSETNLVSILSNLNYDNFKPGIIFLPREGPLSEKTRKLGIKTRIISYYSLKLRNPFRYLSTLANLTIPLLKEKIDLIHLNHQFLIDHASIVSNLTGKPLICHCRCSNLGPFIKNNEKYFFKTRYFVTVSRSIAGELHNYGIDKSKVEVIYDGVDLKKFHRAARSGVLRKEFNFSGSDHIIGIIGRLEPEKGSGDIINAASRVKKYIKNVKFVFIGGSGIKDKDYIAELNLLAKKLGVDDMFIFAGFRSNIPEILHDLDLLVLPSWNVYEALPNILLESMASGVLTLATDVGGVSEIIDDSETGFLAEAKNPDKLADIIVKALQINSQTREQIISSAEKKIREIFSLDKQILKIEELYRKIGSNCGTES